MAVSPFLIFYSTEARAYALMLFLGLLSTLTLLKALDGGRRRWWVAYAVCSCAALYTHYTVAFVLVVQLLWAFVARPDTRRALLLANAAAALGFLPWISQLRSDTSSPCAKLISSLQPFDLHEVRTDLARWSIGHPFIAASSLPGDVALVLAAAGIGAALLGVVLRARTHEGTHRRPASGVTLILLLAFAAPGCAALYSLIGHSVFAPRNLIASSPGLVLAAGRLLTAGRGVLRAAAVTLVLAAVATGGVRMLSARNQRPDYAAAASFIDHAGAPADPVIEVPFPTPGPLTAMYVALRHAGTSAPRIVHSSNSARPLFPRSYVRAPPAPARALRLSCRRRRRRLSHRRRRLAQARASCFWSPWARWASRRCAGTRAAPSAPFIAALPPRYGYVETRRFPGLAGGSVSVYVFRDRQGPG